MTLGRGLHHTASGRAIFGAIGDSAPDRWGRVLIPREERRKAREEKRAPRALLEADYLLGVGDIARQGGLRFAEQENGPFLAAGMQIPPLVQLPAPLGAVVRLSEDGGGTDDNLRLLLAPGSSLGGARPKASIIDSDKQLAIAKFPQQISRASLASGTVGLLRQPGAHKRAAWRGAYHDAYAALVRSGHIAMMGSLAIAGVWRFSTISTRR